MVLIHFAFTVFKPSFRLSAYLAEATKETKYKNAAIRSAKWIKAHMISPNNVVLDSLNGASCARSASSWIFTYNSGKVIEGLSVLHDITKDAQWDKLSVVPSLTLSAGRLLGG